MMNVLLVHSKAVEQEKHQHIILKQNMDRIFTAVHQQLFNIILNADIKSQMVYKPGFVIDNHSSGSFITKTL